VCLSLVRVLLGGLPLHAYLLGLCTDDVRDPPAPRDSLIKQPHAGRPLLMQMQSSALACATSSVMALRGQYVQKDWSSAPS